MQIDDLINQLSSELKEVKPQMSVKCFAVTFSALCLLVVALGLAAVHLRADWQSRLGDASVILDLLSSLALMLSSIALVGWLSSPGRGRGAVGLYLMVAFVAIIFAFAVFRSLGLSSFEVHDGLDLAGRKCFLAVLVFSLIPTLAMTLVCRQRAPVYPIKSGMALALAAMAAGTLAITLHCPIDNGVHIALWHFLLPLSLGAVAGFIIGCRFLRW